MNREQYRAQVDALSFSSDFQDRTMARLAQEKERKPMKKMNLKAVLLAAAVVAAMSVTAYAAITLAPRDVAQRAGNEALAAAFEGEDAITVNETKTVGDYNVTLMGLVSGTGLSRVESLPDSVDQDKTYAVLAYARTDGADITEGVPDLTVSPLVEGYAPWRLNAWTLGGGVSSFAQEGVLYYLFECDDMEPFADHTVYLAVYPGTHTPPSAELFGFEDATGVITSKGEAALFSLPLDESKANAQKAEELAGIWDQPQPAAPQTSGEALPADGEFIIWSDGETESVIVIE